MAGNRAYFLDGRRFTPSQFSRLSRARKIEAMLEWFHDHYYDPAVDLPYDGREGGYQWVNGSPSTPDEALHGEFGDLVDDDVVDEASNQLEQMDWSPSRDDGIYSIDEPFPDIDQPVLDLPELGPGESYWTYEDGRFVLDEAGRRLIVTSGPSVAEAYSLNNWRPKSQALSVRDEMLIRLNDLETIIRERFPLHGGLGHNQPPSPIEDDPLEANEFEAALIQIVMLRDTAGYATPDISIAERSESLFRLLGRKSVSWLMDRANGAIDSAIATAIPVTVGGIAIGFAYRLAIALMAAAQSVADWLASLPTAF